MILLFVAFSCKSCELVRPPFKRQLLCALALDPFAVPLGLGLQVNDLLRVRKFLWKRIGSLILISSS